MKTDNKKLPSLSVIMPCLNEQDNVLNAIENTILAFEKFFSNITSFIHCIMLDVEKA